MKKNLQGIIMLVFLSLTMAGCYPDGPDYVDEYDVVYTNYDQDYQFSGKSTYAIPDSVVKITGAAVTGDPVEFVNPAYASIILDRIKQNMTSRGYTLVDLADADLVIIPSAMEVTNISYYYDYWGYYYGWYYPYGGWYYPYPVVTSYTTGSVIISMIDNTDPNPSDKYRAPWIAIGNGLLEGASTDYAGRIRKMIDQSFEQSQYLHP